MKIDSLSIKSTTIAIFSMIGFIAIFLTLLAGSYFKQTALDAQINSLSRVIEVASQEMLKKGYLASNCVYVCTEHSDHIMESYFTELSEVFATIKDCEDGKSIDELLTGPVCHSGFKRLN